MNDIASSFFLKGGNEMRYLLTFIVCDIVFGLAMYGYIWVQWHTFKKLIANHGWSLECANPTLLRDIWRWFVPIYGLLMYMTVGIILEQMAYTSKRDCGNRLEVSVFGYDSVYSEPVE
jgi:hypothetical protein